MSSKRPSFFLLIVADFIGYIYSAIPSVISWTVPLCLIYLVRDDLLLLVSAILLTPLIAALLFIFICFLFQRSLPKMKPGIYRPGFSKGAIIWHLNNCLANGVEIGCFKTLIFSNKILKWLYFRAMGAKIAFGIFSSTLITLREYPLITIGEGSSISAYCHISCHNFQGDKILLAPITIGKNVFIGMKTLIGPKTIIGDDVFIGVENSLVFDKIESGKTVANFEFEYGNPTKKLAPSHIKS
jgi:acetyltransferase-like isoleucine patch superfamily enzyme